MNKVGAAKNVKCAFAEISIADSMFTPGEVIQGTTISSSAITKMNHKQLRS